jgi:hypothetical protein
MKILALSISLAIVGLFSGCATTTKPVEAPRKSFELREDYKNDRKVGLLGHVNETYPKGHYRAVFEDEKGIFYMNEKRIIISEVRRGHPREEAGGIYISHDKTTYFSHVLLNGEVDTSAVGISPGTGGAAGALIAYAILPEEGTPIPRYEILSDIEDYMVWHGPSANQSR